MIASSFVCLPQSLFHRRFSAICTPFVFRPVDLSSTVVVAPSFFRLLHAFLLSIDLHRELCKVLNIKMKKGRGEIKTRTNDRLRAAGITGSRKSLATEIQNLSSSSEERTEDIMAEGSGGKRESPGTSKKRMRTETKKEEATVQKKQRIKSLVSRKRVYRGKGKKQKEVEGKDDTESESEKEKKVHEEEEVEEDEQADDQEDEEKQDEEEKDEEEEGETAVGEDSNSSTSEIPPDTRKRSKTREKRKKVNDDEVFDGYPWGIVAFDLLVDFMNRAVCSKGQTGISMGGFIFPILTWAYEVIPTLSTPPNFFATRISNEVPRIINWAADTQPKWKDLKQKVFDSPTLEVSPMLATPDEVGMPFFASFIETEKDILKEAEDELRKNKKILTT
uniref:Protein Ycf2-like n=1 Tax=Cucumis melo TaxID=3656 RepID=A0A9I9E4X6_CUCME